LSSFAAGGGSASVFAFASRLAQGQPWALSPLLQIGL
jgi:hypothetical protein